MADEITFCLADLPGLLARTPVTLRAMLAGMDDRWAKNNYGQDTFSPFDVVGHLVHAENTNWMARARMILSQGEDAAFPPFDRYAMYRDSEGKSLRQLLDEFEASRKQSLGELAELGITEADLSRRGKHPDLGGVTLGQLLATWVVHDLNHVHQVAKCLAHQYRRAVGPWRAYIPFLAQD